MKRQIAPREYYHIYNRGNDKQDIFFEESDWIRFLFLILHFQSPLNFDQIGRFTSFVEHRVFDKMDKDVVASIIGGRYVELVNFALMPNHFHIIVAEIEPGGISRYMQRVLNSYTKYINKKYGRIGHLFQGPYKIVHIENDGQLLHTSAYIHRNPRELKDWKGKEIEYVWSSFQDCAIENRWGDLLAHGIVTERFSEEVKGYENFVNTSPAKVVKGELDFRI